MRATLIPIVTIPISLIATFTVLFALGFSINTLTLLAMVLAIGLVVDDAIVVLENIHRHIEQGMTPMRPPSRARREIGFAVVAMTMTLVAVFAPIAFAPGRTGRLFLEFALTLAGAVIVSGFVALTLTPMMCSKLLRHEDKGHGRIFTAIERGLAGSSAATGACWPRRCAAASASSPVRSVIAALSGVFFALLPSELAPVEDRGADAGARHRPRGCDARLHQPLQPAGRRHHGPGPGDRVRPWSSTAVRRCRASRPSGG